MQSEADPSGSEASDCEAGDTFYVAAPELNLSEDSDDDAAAASVVMPPAPDEYVRQLGDQLSIFTLVGDKLDEARAGGARWRVLNELVAPFVGSNEPAMIDAFLAAGGMKLLVSIVAAAPETFVDDLFPTDRALRPRFPAPIELLPTAVLASAHQHAVFGTGINGGVGSSGGSSGSHANDPAATLAAAAATKFGRAANAPLPPASPTLDPPAVVSFRFAAIFFLSILVNHERYRAAAMAEKLLPALTALLTPKRKALLSRSLLDVLHSVSAAVDRNERADLAAASGTVGAGSEHAAGGAGGGDSSLPAAPDCANRGGASADLKGSPLKSESGAAAAAAAMEKSVDAGGRGRSLSDTRSDGSRDDDGTSASASASAAAGGSSGSDDDDEGEALLLDYALADRIVCALCNLARSPSVPLINALVAECAQQVLGIAAGAAEANIARLAVRFFIASAPRASAANVLRLRQLGAARMLKSAEAHCHRADADCGPTGTGAGSGGGVLLRHALGDLLQYFDRSASRPASASVHLSSHAVTLQTAARGGAGAAAANGNGAVGSRSQFSNAAVAAAAGGMSVGPLLEALGRVAAAQALEEAQEFDELLPGEVDESSDSENDDDEVDSSYSRRLKMQQQAKKSVRNKSAQSPQPQQQRQFPTAAAGAPPPVSLAHTKSVASAAAAGGNAEHRRVRNSTAHQRSALSAAGTGIMYSAAPVLPHTALLTSYSSGSHDHATQNRIHSNHAFGNGAVGFSAAPRAQNIRPASSYARTSFGMGASGIRGSGGGSDKPVAFHSQLEPLQHIRQQQQHLQQQQQQQHHQQQQLQYVQQQKQLALRGRVAHDFPQDSDDAFEYAAQPQQRRHHQVAGSNSTADGAGYFMGPKLHADDDAASFQQQQQRPARLRSAHSSVSGLYGQLQQQEQQQYQHFRMSQEHYLQQEQEQEQQQMYQQHPQQQQYYKFDHNAQNQQQHQQNHYQQHQPQQQIQMLRGGNRAVHDERLVHFPQQPSPPPIPPTTAGRTRAARASSSYRATPSAEVLARGIPTASLLPLPSQLADTLRAPSHASPPMFASDHHMMISQPTPPTFSSGAVPATRTAQRQWQQQQQQHHAAYTDFAPQYDHQDMSYNYQMQQQLQPSHPSLQQQQHQQQHSYASHSGSAVSRARVTSASPHQHALPQPHVQHSFDVNENSAYAQPRPLTAQRALVPARLGSAVGSVSGVANRSAAGIQQSSSPASKQQQPPQQKQQRNSSAQFNTAAHGSKLFSGSLQQPARSLNASAVAVGAGDEEDDDRVDDVHIIDDDDSGPSAFDDVDQ